MASGYALAATRSWRISARCSASCSTMCSTIWRMLVRPVSTCWPVRAQFQFTSVVSSSTVSARYRASSRSISSMSRVHVAVLGDERSWSYGSSTGSVCVDIM